MGLDVMAKKQDAASNSPLSLSEANARTLIQPVQAFPNMSRDHLDSVVQQLERRFFSVDRRENYCFPTCAKAKSLL
jgi:hypothetical protein